MPRLSRVAVIAMAVALVGTTNAVASPVAAASAPAKAVVASASGNGWLAIRWTAPTVTGSVAGYQVSVRRYLPSTARWTATTYVSVGASVRARTVRYANGTKAQLAVRPRNASGYGPWASITTVAGLPGAVPWTTARVNDRSATVSWSAAASNGSSITKYRVYVRSTAGGAWTSWADRSVPASARSTTFTGRSYGRTYQFVVKAVNGRGVGGARESVKVRIVQPAPPTTAPPTTAPPTTAPPAVSPEIARILADTNAFRAQNGKAPLVLMPALNTIAGDWAQHLHDTCTFEHRSSFSVYPSGWQSAGENIAAGYSDMTVVQGWIDSPGHRANMLGDYTHLGLGYYQGANCYRTYFVQNFARY